MLNKFRVIHLNCTSCDFASPLARSGANNKASVSLVAICSDMFRLASRRSQMSYQPHDLPLLVLHSWGARGHTARLRAAHAASRAEDARSYTPTGGFQLVLLPLFTASISYWVWMSLFKTTSCSRLHRRVPTIVVQYRLLLHLRWVLVARHRTPFPRR